MKNHFIVAPDPETPASFMLHGLNLADASLGASVVEVSDEFFAPCERMLNPEPAKFYPGLYDENGKWMDGWESRRKRVAGHDWCIIKLAYHGMILGVDVDTSFFTGNFPPAIAIEAIYSPKTDPLIDDPSWQTIVSTVTLTGNFHHLIEVNNNGTWTHLRVNMYPDGGIARLRVYGQVIPNLSDINPTSEIDLIALSHGGRAVAWNDAHYGSPHNILRPNRGVNMGDGWETRRRREPGNDWCIIKLGFSGFAKRLEIDTAHFKGNYPAACSIQAAYVPNSTDQSIATQSMFWPTLLSEHPLSADQNHQFELTNTVGQISHIRLNIIPDGGVSRLRLWGMVK